MSLIEKQDVCIPPIDTLELIAEPDGSPAEDLVIPAEFEKLQRQQQLQQPQPRQQRSLQQRQLG